MPAIFIAVLVLIFLIMIKFNDFNEEVCGDGTAYGNCSLRKPYFCLDGVLVEKASVCGCPDMLTIEGDLCISNYQTNPKNITLKYVLRGEEMEIDFLVYKGMIDYISTLPNAISSNRDIEPSRQDFKLRNINEKEQRELLLPLSTKIQNLAEDKIDQARIAISLVQNIPYLS